MDISLSILRDKPSLSCAGMAHERCGLYVRLHFRRFGGLDRRSVFHDVDYRADLIFNQTKLNDAFDQFS
ncbi:MAG: hypothetical protein KF914_13975 [Rhizobiaceae bacterium]|nr:hypothetical protein [Rhizobiaceae bacterium]